MSTSRFIWQQAGDGLVLLDTERGRYYELNATAAAMFVAIHAGQKPTSIIEDICAEFDVDPDRASTDLEALRQSLERIGVIHADS